MPKHLMSFYSMCAESWFILLLELHSVYKSQKPGIIHGRWNAKVIEKLRDNTMQFQCIK